MRYVSTIGKRLALLLMSTPCGTGCKILSCLAPLSFICPGGQASRPSIFSC